MSFVLEDCALAFVDKLVAFGLGSLLQWYKGCHETDRLPPKAQERELEEHDQSGRAVGILNPMRGQYQGVRRGREG